MLTVPKTGSQRIRIGLFKLRQLGPKYLLFPRPLARETLNQSACVRALTSSSSQRANVHPPPHRHLLQAERISFNGADDLTQYDARGFPHQGDAPVGSPAGREQASFMHRLNDLDDGMPGDTCIGGQLIQFQGFVPGVASQITHHLYGVNCIPWKHNNKIIYSLILFYPAFTDLSTLFRRKFPEALMQLTEN